MKKRITLFILVFFIICSGLFAQMTFSGILDSTLSLQAGAGSSPEFSHGLEEYANIRFQSKLRDRGTFFGAVNFFAIAGDPAANIKQIAEFYALTDPGLNPTSFVSGQNYIAGIELERLYFRLNGEIVSVDGGLFRLPFGFSQVWGPSDFLNPKNPLKPDARPRGILGASVYAYPVDSLKILGFFATPRNPFSREGDGRLAGICVDQHYWDSASLQFLYSYEMPQSEPHLGFTVPKLSSNKGIHRAGISVKADVEISIVMDALYTYNHEAKTKWDGLSFSTGLDYSFFGGDLIVLAEYLYNGSSSSTALGFGGSFSNEHYLYTGLTWRFNDFANMSFALISCFDDISFTPLIILNHDIFQGATLTVSAQVPLDRDLFSGDGNRGELGPLPPGSPFGYYFNCSIKLRLRF